MRRLPLYVGLFLVAIVVWAVGFSADVQAEHGYGSYGCSGGYAAADYGCSSGAYADAGCSGRAGLFRGDRRPVRRLLGVPVRAVKVIVISPTRALFGRRGCGG